METVKLTSLETSIELSKLNLPIKNKFHYLAYLNEVGKDFDSKSGLPTIPAYTEEELWAYVPKQLHVPYLNSKEQTQTWELKYTLVPGEGDSITHYLFYSKNLYSPIYEVKGNTKLEALLNLILAISKEYDSEGKYKL